ncbi:MAG: cation:proton antiporter, partial [Gammaproteobacteria bacterium]|nr:cation:proton antiporter [Gammaproteobacteria bacterium]
MALSEIILVVTGLLGVAMVAAALCRNLPIPFTVFLVLIGMGLRWLGESRPEILPIADFTLTPDLVFFVFLPALIFESALNLDARQLVRNLAPILALAIPAMLLSTALVGLGLAIIMDFDPVTALLFGALISATDPVAVVALFKELGAPVRLTTLVEGESLFNDATAIVLFHILLAMAVSGSAFGWGELAASSVEFVRVFLGGAMLGAVTGIAISETMRRLRANALSLLIMSLVTAYAGFVLAEHYLHVSGVMAAVGGALALGVYAVTRVPQTALRSIHEVWEVIALVCNSLLFLMIGLTVNVAALAERALPILMVAVLVVLARAAAVYTLAPATTRLFRLPRIKTGELHVMWWGGLKGGLAIAIVLSLPQSLPGRQLLVELTLGVVLFTLLVNAPTIRPLISFLGVDRLTDDERAELARGLDHARKDAQSVLDELRAAGIVSPQAQADIERQIADTFRAEGAEASQARAQRRAFLEALRFEIEELERLFDIGLIDEYTYLDLRSTLRRDRHYWTGTEEQDGTASDGTSLFVRVESALLRQLREHNWAAGLLARYQRLRLSHRLQRDIAGIMTCQAVLRGLEDRAHLAPGLRAPVATVYRHRLQKRQVRVAAIRREFPELYERFERHYFLRAALANARERIADAAHHGELPGKAHVQVDRCIETALRRLPELPLALSRLGPRDLIRGVPLFQNLPEPVVAKLATHARTVNFLPGDVVIGEGERGSSLYVIVRGTVAVTRAEPDGSTQRLATLGTGDFFGETALLGDETRTATVVAEEPATLLRLNRREVL